MRAAQRYHKFTIKTRRCQPNGTARSAQGVLLQLRGIAIAITACKRQNTASNASFLGDTATPSLPQLRHMNRFSLPANRGETGKTMEPVKVSGVGGGERPSGQRRSRGKLGVQPRYEQVPTKNANVKTNTGQCTTEDRFGFREEPSKYVLVRV